MHTRLAGILMLGKMLVVAHQAIPWRGLLWLHLVLEGGAARLGFGL
ncbi:MAG: hypothetical protein ACYYK0_08000 [Candidatus Eutrophobiaceae bacterium]